MRRAAPEVEVSDVTSGTACDVIYQHSRFHCYPTVAVSALLYVELLISVLNCIFKRVRIFSKTHVNMISSITL